MHTVFDWLALIVFAGLAVIFLQRSVEGESMGRMWIYLPPAIGCALANWLGNNEYPLPSVLILALCVGWILFIVKPELFKR